MNYFRSFLISKITQKSFIITLDSPSKYNGVTPHPHPSAACGGYKKVAGRKAKGKVESTAKQPPQQLQQHFRAELTQQLQQQHKATTTTAATACQS